MVFKLMFLLQPPFQDEYISLVFAQENLNNLKIYEKFYFFSDLSDCFFMRFLNCNVLLICCFVLWFCCLFFGFFCDFCFVKLLIFLISWFCLCFSEHIELQLRYVSGLSISYEFCFVVYSTFFEIVYSLPDVYSSFVVIFPELYVLLLFPEFFQKCCINQASNEFFF